MKGPAAAAIELAGPQRDDRPRRLAPGVGPLLEDLPRRILGLYMLLFFAYMFLPLALMAAAAFNEASSPTISPWRGTTLKWFGVLLRDRQMWDAVVSTMIIAAGVVVLSLPLGLAAALLLNRLQSRLRGLLYGIFVSPILIPGVVLGISTLIFWDQLDVPGGLFLAVIGQTTYVASYCMLLFMARLQRFDPSWEEAALDLGAPPAAVFRAITIPFLMPAILAAAAIGFLQSIESYNTALFTIGNRTTMTVFIAAKVRLGLNPSVNALAVVFIAVTLLFAALYEWRRRAARA